MLVMQRSRWQHEGEAARLAATQVHQKQRRQHDIGEDTSTMVATMSARGLQWRPFNGKDAHHCNEDDDAIAMVATAMAQTQAR